MTTTSQLPEEVRQAIERVTGTANCGERQLLAQLCAALAPLWPPAPDAATCAAEEISIVVATDPGMPRKELANVAAAIIARHYGAGQAAERLAWARKNCRVVYFPPDGSYPIEHAPHAGKDMWEALCVHADAAHQTPVHAMKSQRITPERPDKVVCHADSERCLGCDHYHGKADVCKYAPALQGATPMTDANILLTTVGKNGTKLVTADFARGLERKLVDCRRTCDELVTDGDAISLAKSLQRKVNELAAEKTKTEHWQQRANDISAATESTVETLRAELSAAKADSERLDWLQAEHSGDIKPLMALSVKVGNIRDSSDWANLVPKCDLRAVIDDARKEDAKPPGRHMSNGPVSRQELP